MSDLSEAIRRAEGRHLTGDEIVRQIEAYNRGAAAVGGDDVPICFQDGEHVVRLIVDRNVGPESILAIEAVVEAAKDYLKGDGDDTGS